MAKKDGGASDIAAQDRADEQARQQRIREGTDRINRIFDVGTPTAADKIAAGAAYDPGKTYYNADGSVWTPPGGGGTVTDSNNPFAGAGLASAVASGQPTGDLLAALGAGAPSVGDAFGDATKAGGVYGGVSSGAFNDDFYNKQRQAYIDYAKPQLDDQYSQAQKQLTFALARGGNLDSSARSDLAGKLRKQYDQSAQQVADQGLSYENTARNNVEDARSQLISMLNSTGDASGAANQALSRAASLSAQPAYSPLSNMFADFTNGLGAQSALEQANYYSNGAVGPRYKTGLFAPNPSAVAVK